MPNPIRGQIAFTVRAVERYVQYGTREIAEAQAALGFHRPDPQQPDTTEEIEVPLFRDIQKKNPRLDKGGQQQFRKMRILVDAKQRQKRVIEALEACVMDPDPAASVVFFRIGLGPWQREHDAKLSREQILEIVDALGLEKLRLLHMQALSTGCYMTGDDAEADEGKAAGGASASST